MEIIVETYVPAGEPSLAGLRVRPLPRQGVDPNLKVECSLSMRRQYPAGALFRLTMEGFLNKERVLHCLQHPRKETGKQTAYFLGEKERADPKQAHQSRQD